MRCLPTSGALTISRDAMRLNVRHTTHYNYEALPSYLIQRLHLEPAGFATQRILSWRITAPGMEKALRYCDGFGNWVHLITSVPSGDEMEIVAEGEVETSDAAGVVRGLPGLAPEAVFLRRTAATQSDNALSDLARSFNRKKPVLETAHALMQAVHGEVRYEVGTSDAHTTAIEAFVAKAGVCQDHAHIMIAVARAMGIPARYVTGYLVTGVGASSSAAHAWAELFVPELGWVGFDAANGQCPTEHYVRVAAGLDAAAVAPVRGTRRGGAGFEQLRVEVRVEISQQ
jgi:transglutaminase-like putative cysteine protease